MKANTGKRYRITYRRENCYIVLTGVSLDISMVDPDAESETLAGLDVISSLVTLLLEEGVDREEISARVWEQSRNKGDLADHLSMILLQEVDGEHSS